VLDQGLGDADPPGRVELLVEGAAVEAAAQAAGVLAERAVRREEAIRGADRELNISLRYRLPESAVSLSLWCVLREKNGGKVEA